jgi:hypothetical protein
MRIDLSNIRAELGKPARTWDIIHDADNALNERVVLLRLEQWKNHNETALSFPDINRWVVFWLDDTSLRNLMLAVNDAYSEASAIDRGVSKDDTSKQ